MESPKSFTEISYHSSDDEVEVTETNHVEEETVYEESEVYDEGEGVEALNDTENSSGPVKSNAPLPLHQLLANKLKNTNVKLTEPGERKPRSVKEMAAAFSPPRPASFSRKTPIDTGRVKGASVWPTTEQFNKSPEQKSLKRTAIQPQTSPSAQRPKPPEKKKPIFKLKPVNIRKVSTKGPVLDGRRSATRTAPRPITVEPMEVLSEGSRDDSSGSRGTPTPIAASLDQQSSSSSNDPVSKSRIQPNENPNRTRIFDGSLSGTSTSSSNRSSSGSSSHSGRSDYSFSVSSGTDESLAAKLGELGTPFEPLPIAANFIPDTANYGDSGSSSSSSPEGRRSTSGDPNRGPDAASTRRGSLELQRQVSWSDLLGDDSKNKTIPTTVSNAKNETRSLGDEGPNRDDDSDSESESYESYETASSEEEFETDSERERSKKSVGPPGLSLLDDQESAETSDYETDTTFERKYAESEGRTPPPPKKPTLPFFSLLEKSKYSPMPVLDENETKQEWPNGVGLRPGIGGVGGRTRPPGLKSESYYQKRSRRRKPFEDVPTAVSAELRKVSKNDPAMSGNDATPLGIAGWDGRDNQGSGNCFDQVFKKKGAGEVGDNVKDPDDLPRIPLPPSPPTFHPPDYDNDDDEISNITDRVFSPKKPKVGQDSSDGSLVVDARTRSTTEDSGHFSITSFRKSNSIRNTERALEGLRTTSINPSTRSRSIDENRNISALLNMQNETVDFYYSHDHGHHDISQSSSRAFDSRDVEMPIMDRDFNNDYDPYTTEIIEERFIGYDDNDDAIHSRFNFDEEEEAQDEASNRRHSSSKKNTAIKMERKSKRLRCITYIVICNLLLLLGIAAWFLIDYFILEDRSGSSLQAGKTSEQIKAQLTSILKPGLPDGGSSFDQATSPQSQALDWLSNDPLIHTYENEKISIRFVLATFYYATGGDTWTTNHLWLSDLDECLWYTSSSESPCNEDGHYSRLVLTDNNLQGKIPDELSMLSNSLIDLDVDGTFTGEIPFNIGDLVKLTSLRLSGRVLSGKIPDSLYRLSNLSSLDLGQNVLTGEVSGAIGTMSSSLTSLSLASNHLTGSIPKEVGQLTELKEFNIDDNYFSFISPVDLGRLTNLETLSMRNNALNGSLPSTIGSSLSNLKGLFLNNNAFTGTIPNSYGNLSKLETGLDLSSNRLTGRVPESLGQLSMLRNLLVRDNDLTGTIPSSWGKLSILTTLRLDSTKFEGEMPTELCNNFQEEYSSFYVDCWKLDCPCCNFCCDGSTGDCICRFADSIPILCVEP